MRYALTAPERAFREAVREFAGRAAPGMPDALARDFGEWLSAAKPEGLSRVEEVIALEETVRRCPAAACGLVGSGLFGGSTPGLCRAAADLGAARGVLVRWLARPSKIRDGREDLLQNVADVLTEIETARLKLYRAAILEDAGREDPEETTGAELLAEALSREAGRLADRLGTGGDDETRSVVQESCRNRDRQRPEGAGGDPQGPGG